MGHRLCLVPDLASPSLSPWAMTLLPSPLPLLVPSEAQSTSVHGHRPHPILTLSAFPSALCPLTPATLGGGPFHAGLRTEGDDSPHFVRLAELVGARATVLTSCPPPPPALSLGLQEPEHPALGCGQSSGGPSWLGWGEKAKAGARGPAGQEEVMGGSGPWPRAERAPQAWPRSPCQPEGLAGPDG